MSLRHSSGKPIAGLAVAGAALVLGYPPFSIPVVPFVGLVPLLVFLERPRPTGECALGTAAFAIPYIVGTTGWLFLLARFTPAGAAGAAIAEVLQIGTFGFFAAGFVVSRRLARVPMAVAAPVLWVVGEHARTYGDLSFAWATLGSSLSDWPRLIQHADLIGVWGLSLWLVLVNALVATAISGSRTRRVRIAAAAAAVAAVGLALGYGAARISWLGADLDRAPRLRVAAVQPNIPQRLKWSAAARNENVAALGDVVRSAEGAAPDLVVAPEASLPLVVAAEADRLPPAVASGTRPLLLGIVRGIGGLVPAEEDGVRGYRYARHRNSAVLVAPDRSILGVHDKTVLVPMTEAIPFRRVFGFLLPFMRRQFGRFEAGGPPRPIELDTDGRTVRLGVLICFEALEPADVREVVDRGADVLVHITNDAWFGGSNMPAQHLGLAALRAIETRRAIVRSANTGITALIDPLGEVTARAPADERAVLLGDVRLSHVTTVYDRTGDLALVLAYAGAALLLLDAARGGRRGSRT